MKNVRNPYNSRQKIFDLLNDYSKIRSEAMYETKQGAGVEILTNASKITNCLCTSKGR